MAQQLSCCLPTMSMMSRSSKGLRSAQLIDSGHYSENRRQSKDFLVCKSNSHCQTIQFYRTDSYTTGRRCVLLQSRCYKYMFRLQRGFCRGSSWHSKEHLRKRGHIVRRLVDNSHQWMQEYLLQQPGAQMLQLGRRISYKTLL